MVERKMIAGLIAFFAFLFMLLLVLNGGIATFDDEAAKLFTPLKFLSIFNVLGTQLIIGGGSIMLILYLWWRKKNYFGILLLLIAVAGGNLVNKWLKAAVGRERPPLAQGEEGFSFTSGHAMVGMIFYLLLAFFINQEVASKKIRIMIYSAGVLSAVLTGLSRIVTHAHYPSDVFAGYLAGVTIFMFTTGVYGWNKK
ncbi:phosphatase PAP2 family protein [Falsibacillus albus]|uniref:Phosphatase PAP2 family protein n=1 Tax=Falsibacillus albus TaxID=2478915 RepID=A0A3L7K2G4_9BACI|nr:phosphatase PAP2 family protein [Falsibacillus albus]RLQ97287.1 phosphatase PAP2 family protein [Falsibacillus albus]